MNPPSLQDPGELVTVPRLGASPQCPPPPQAGTPQISPGVLRALAGVSLSVQSPVRAGLGVR